MTTNIRKRDRMVQLKQISVMLDIIEAEPELASGRCSRTHEGRTLAKQRWAEISDILNAVSSDCPTKGPEEWRSFFNDYKSKVLKKLKFMSLDKKSGAPITPLTPLQQRLCNIVGWDVKDILANPRRALPANHQTKKLSIRESLSNRIAYRQFEAISEQARATNRLAAAINGLGATMDQSNTALLEAISKLGDIINGSNGILPKKKLKCKISIVPETEPEENADVKPFSFI